MKSSFSLKISEHLSSPLKKVIYNQEHFTESAPRYDIATRLMSFAQDCSWKKRLVSLLPNFNKPQILDLATGTGDLPFELIKKYPDATILGIDLTEAMLAIARKRNHSQQISFECHSIDKLPFPERFFQIISGSYALRNSPDLQQTLTEIYRCLSDDGVVGILDFAKPNLVFLQKIQFYLLKFWGSMWGIILHRNPEVHGYISASLAVYPSREKLDKMIRLAGFSKIIRESKFCGMIDLLIIQK